MKPLVEFLISKANPKKMSSPIYYLIDYLKKYVGEYDKVIQKLDKWNDDDDFIFGAELIVTALNDKFTLANYSSKGNLLYCELDGGEKEVTPESKIVRIMSYGPDGIHIELLNLPKLMDDMLIIQDKVLYFRANWNDYETFAKDYGSGNADYKEIFDDIVPNMDDATHDKIYEIFK